MDKQTWVKYGEKITTAVVECQRADGSTIYYSLYDLYGDHGDLRSFNSYTTLEEAKEALKVVAGVKMLDSEIIDKFEEFIKFQLTQVPRTITKADIERPQFFLLWYGYAVPDKEHGKHDWEELHKYIVEHSEYN